MNAAPKPKPTPTQQQAKIADLHPQVKLVPAEAAPTHPKTGQTTCGAIRWHNGIHVSCTLKAGHQGDHEEVGGSWRRRSGDPS